MHIALALPLVFLSVSADELSTGYIHEIRGDLALAERIVLKPSPANGGGQYTITDANTIRSLGRLVDRKSKVHTSDGNIATASYVVIEIYSDRGADVPDRQITVIPKMGLFEPKGRIYEFNTKHDAMYKSLLKFMHTEKEKGTKDGE